MTNTRKNNGLTELSVAVAPARSRHRELIGAAVELAGRAGPDGRSRSLALICAGAEYAGELRRRADEVHADPLDPDWASTTCCAATSRTGARCSGCPWPLELPQVMWAWFDFLHGTGRLDPASDPVAELRKPLACYGWLDQDGPPLPPGRRSGEIPCECLLPYRETTELLAELIRQSERSGEDPLDRLRWLVGRPTAVAAGGALPVLAGRRTTSAIRRACDLDG